jgi:hypothetical protein
MYRPALRRLALRVGLLMLLLILALLTACGAPEEAKPRPLPEDRQPLSPGTYRSEEFEPSFSFTVGEGWTNEPLEASDELLITRGESAGLGFARLQNVYKPTTTGTPNLVDAPEDLVRWNRHHPYLRTSKPEPVTVGGVEGVRFDEVVAEDLPKDHYSVCGSDCVDISRLSSGSLLFIWEGDKVRVIILEDVKGETVTIGAGSPASEFDEFAPEAQKVLDSVEWRGE